MATSDPDVAAKLVAEVAAKLEERKRRRDLGDGSIDDYRGLGEFSEFHLRQKARAGKVTDEWMAQSERMLRRAVAFFGVERELHTIAVRDVQRYAAHLQTTPNGRGGTLSPGSQRHCLNALSNLFRRAQAEGAVRPGYNPVGSMMDKPAPNPGEARWLEVHEVAKLIEAARTYVPNLDRGGYPYTYALLATHALTGARTSEVLGLLVDDVSFDRKAIRFRTNEFRRLKTRGSDRTVTLWPQLEEILRAHLVELERDGGAGKLLFSSLRADREQPLTDWRRMLDAVAVRAGWEPGEIRSKMFRHSYAAARLQTLDHGAPVSVYTVSRELGHASTTMVQKVYAHLGEIRHRAEVVEFPTSTGDRCRVV